MEETARKLSINDISKMAAATEKFFEDVVSMGGYERKTTFSSDLTIAELMGGRSAIYDTNNRIMKEWIDNVEYITEYIMAVNIKSWEWYFILEHLKEDKAPEEHKQKAEEMSKMYADLYYDVLDKVVEHYRKKGDEDAVSYIYSTID